MLLEGKNGNKFELTLVGYQFPRSLSDHHDSNWLIVQMYAAIDGRGWTTQDPSLLTWEVEELTKWLDSLGSNDLPNKDIEFIEPNIRFELASHSSETVTLKVILQLESRAHWPPKTFIGEDEFGLLLDCSVSDVFAWSNDLKAQLKKFPFRNVI